MTMKFERHESDVRGFRYFFSDHGKIITLFQIKKGFIRGGQYHREDVHHFIVSGKVEYHKENVATQEDEVVILEPPSTTTLPREHSDLIIGLEDSFMIGVYPKEENLTFYDKHRKILDENNSKKSKS